MRTLSWILNKLWLTLAIVLVLVAVGLSLLRYSLPYLPDLTEPLEDQLEERFQQPVSISDLSMAWTREGPSIVLNSLVLLEREQSPVQVRVGEVHVVLDFWNTLLERQFIAQQFILDDARIAVDMRKLSATDEAEKLNLDYVNRLFLQQLEKFSLNNGELLLTNLRGVTRKIDIERLSWTNKGNKHQGIGQFRMEDFAANSLNVIIDLRGNRWSEFNGQFYVDSQNVDISPWLEEQLGDIDVQASNVNFTGWLDVRNGRLFEGLLKLRDNRITWLDSNSGQLNWLQLPEGEIVLRPEVEGWLLNSLPMTVNTSVGQLDLPRIAWQQLEGVHDISVDNIAIDDVIELLPLLPFNADSSAESVMSLGLKGEASLRYRLHPVSGQQWAVKSHNLSADGNNSWPSFNGLDLTVNSTANHGLWRIEGSNVRLAGNNLSATQAWDIDTLQLKGSWLLQPEYWQVVLEQMQLNQDDFQLTGSGRLSSSGEGSPQIDLLVATEQPFSVATARQLLPSVMGQGVKDYLTNALVSGQTRGLELLWRGSVDSFPEDESQGVFNARVEFDDLTYQFQPQWLPLADAPVKLDFYSKTLLMSADSGHIEDVQVTRVDAQIQDLTDSERGLQIQASVNGKGESLLPVFEQSPLNSVTETLIQLSPRGELNGSFELDIPFDNSREVGVLVDAPLSGLSISVDALQQDFDVTNGRISIDNSDVTTEGLSLNWYGMPIQAEVSGGLSDEDYRLDVSTTIDWQSEPLFKQFPYPQWEAFFYGAVNGEANLALTFSDNDVGVGLESQFDLTGLETSLPVPLQKDFGESWQLAVSLNGTGEQLRLRANIDERLSWYSRWQPGDNGWQQAELNIGEVASTDDPRNFGGFAVNAKLPEADIGQWYSVLYALAEDSNVETESGNEKGWLPDSINIETPQLQWGQQKFDQADIQVWPENSNWQARVDADNAVISATIPENFVQKGITIRADYLALTSDVELPENTEKTDWGWLEKVPPLNFLCRSCRVDERDLGEVELVLSPLEDGFSIEKMSLKKGSDELLLDGYWRYANEQGLSALSGRLDTEDLGGLLRDYGLETAVRDSAAVIDFDLDWRDHLYQPDWASLNGELTWDLEKGYLAEVSDGGARIFSMLSLDSILRKLTLDFRDIFSQGMFFTDLTGSVQVEDGVANTEDAQLLGSAGDMDIRGWTDMQTGELNYNLTYAPKVTSSLPIILAWMVNPPSGLAALFIDKVLHDAKVISRLRYQVTGTIEEPVVEEIERDSRPVDLPELEENSTDSEADDDTSATDGAADEQSPGSAR
ncbi:YhdP family protein [Idiomarina ramblicola]|uniref:TIGR02099 family protein n=1 Tax=Idiomarina ramblicola TaxID=263724 RepID=A0A432Z241_9GAMM|nr:YhdP family protein [Idiomarina ramblicola]RUO71937.1 TIGR02099 family protein [Idiomarina ramblicola]